MSSGGTVVLDLQGLSGWIDEGPRVMELLAAAHRNQADVVASAMTILEVSHRGLSRPRLDWILSRVRVEPVTRDSARAASALLVPSGLHGHAHAIDAVVAELAARQSRPVALLTSDPGDMKKLGAPHVRVVAV